MVKPYCKGSINFHKRLRRTRTKTTLIKRNQIKRLPFHSVEMHSHVDTEEGITTILLSFELNIIKYDIENTSILQLIRALRLIMKHNVFILGDAYYSKSMEQP